MDLKYARQIVKLLNEGGGYIRVFLRNFIIKRKEK